MSKVFEENTAIVSFQTVLGTNWETSSLCEDHGGCTTKDCAVIVVSHLIEILHSQKETGWGWFGNFGAISFDIGVNSYVRGVREQRPQCLGDGGNILHQILPHLRHIILIPDGGLNLHFTGAIAWFPTAWPVEPRRSTSRQNPPGTYKCPDECSNCYFIAYMDLNENRN